MFPALNTTVKAMSNRGWKKYPHSNRRDVWPK